MISENDEAHDVVHPQLDELTKRTNKSRSLLINTENKSLYRSSERSRERDNTERSKELENTPGSPSAKSTASKGRQAPRRTGTQRRSKDLKPIA